MRERAWAPLMLLALLAACGHGQSAAPKDGPLAVGDAAPPSNEPPPATVDAPPPPVTDAPARDAAPPVTDAAREASAGDAAADGGAASAGCSAAGLPEGDATLVVNGANRSYRLRLPAGYSPQRAWPLVLALHPNGSSVDYWDGADRHLRSTIANKAIVALAAARGGDWRGDLPADLAYFDALITRLESNLCVDTKRIFSIGFSGGGSFSGVLGCMRKDIRAIAVGGAVTYFDPKACVGTPAAWVTIGMGELIPAREEFRDFWRARNGCQPATAPTSPAPCLAYSCPDTPVHYCPHPGGHAWPPFGTDAAWAFFSQF
jgi:polyhydroxybutyrate depolymerase